MITMPAAKASLPLHLSWAKVKKLSYLNACFAQALTAYQAGILLVECFPYIPDLIMLMRELAISQSASSSHELLTKGAMRYAEKQGAADIKVSKQFST